MERVGFTPTRGTDELVEQLLALVERHEQQRMIAQLVAEARVDRVVGQVRERVHRLEGRMTAEADAGARALLRREDPREAIQRALVERRVVLERAPQAADECRLRRAVRAVQQDHLARAPVAHEALQHLVGLVLDHLLAEQAILAVRPRCIEQLEPRDVAPRIFHLLGSVVIEAVDDVLRRRAQLAQRLGEHEREILRERHHAPVAREILAHGVVKTDERGLHRLGELGHDATLA